TTITDDGRIRAALPTLSRLVEAGARVVVISHLGRPKGAPEEKYSLRPVVGRLGELLGQDVAFATDTVGSSAQEPVAGLEGCGVVRGGPAAVAEPATRLPAAAGELVLDEVEALRKVADQPERPFVVVLGGAKIADKLGVIDSLLGKADRILIGGGMAYTFQK